MEGWTLEWVGGAGGRVGWAPEEEAGGSAENSAGTEEAAVVEGGAMKKVAGSFPAPLLLLAPRPGAAAKTSGSSCRPVLN